MPSIFRSLDVLLKVLPLNNFILFLFRLVMMLDNYCPSLYKTPLFFQSSSGKKSRQTGGGGERSRDRHGEGDKAGSSTHQAKFRIPKGKKEERKH